MRIKGFKVAAIEANLRYKDRLDLGLIVADKLCAAAAVFTKSLAKAAPVIWGMEKIKNKKARAILVNAGYANAQTGAKGLSDCKILSSTIAELISSKEEEILLASTGIIGQDFNTDKFKNCLPKLVKKLSEPDISSLNDFADSILTTDTCRKIAEETIELAGEKIKIWGACKGSGMIAPNMATMLGFILTDANIEADDLSKILLKTTEKTFNNITVDGDTSTNDTVFALASACTGPLLKGKDLDIFELAFFKVMSVLARKIVKDAEGATHLVEIEIKGAKTKEEAGLAARTVAQSPLVKTALFGKDANWGRILAALGRSGADFDPYKVDIDLNDVAWIRNGIDNKQEEAANKIMALDEYRIKINLNNGNFKDEILTCDLSYEYVKINSDYRS